MSRELLARMLVRMYPAEVRRTRGNELVGTLLDAGDTSTWMFVSHMASVARAALLARSRDELTRPAWQLAAGAVCWAAVLTAMTTVIEGIGASLYWGGTVFSYGNDPQTILDMYALPVLILGLFTTGHNRTAALLGLLCIAMRLHQSPMISLADFMITVPVPAVGFGLLAARPRDVRAAGRYLWLIPAAMWTFYWLTLLGQHSGIGKMTPAIASLALLPIAPSLALGLGIDWLLQGVRYLTYPGGDHFPLWTVEFLACLPAALLLTAACRHTPRLTHPSR